MKFLTLAFLFLPYFLFAQNIDRSLYQEISLQEAHDIRASNPATIQYYRSLAHFERTYFNQVMGRLNVIIYMTPNSFTTFNYFGGHSLGIRIEPFQVVMLYYRFRREGTAFRSILDHIEIVDKFLIAGTRYTVMENLRLRSYGNLTGEIIRTIPRGELVTVLEEGNQETINGLTSIWVRVRLNDNTEGWCFGGYLGVRLRN